MGSPGARLVVANFAALSVMQAASYLLPLLLIPYLTRTLGIDRYGLVALGQSFGNAFLVLIEFGFGLWAASEIAMHRSDPNRVADVASAVIASRLLLVGAGMVLAAGSILAVGRFRHDWTVFALSFCAVAANALTVDWLFQGLERMHLTATITIGARLLAAAAIVATVRGPSDYLYVPVLQGAGVFVGGIWALVVARRRCAVQLHVPGAAAIAAAFAGSHALFASRALSSFYVIGNTLVLGLVAPDAVVGYYSIAERLTSAIGSLATPFNQAVYPSLARRFATARATYDQVKQRILVGLLVATGAVAIAVAIGASPILTLASGHGTPQGVLLVRVLSATIVLGPLAAYLTQLLVIQGQSSELTRIVMLAAAVHAAGLAVVLPRSGAGGLAMLVIVVHALVVTMVAARSGVDVQRPWRSSGTIHE